MTVALLAVAFGAATGLACLNGYLSVDAEFKLRWAVFAGTVVSERSEPPTQVFDQEGTTYVVRVDEVFKGRPGEQVRLFSENTNAAFPMKIGTKYLLFVYRDHGRLIVDNCGNSEAYEVSSRTFRVVKKLSRQS